MMWQKLLSITLVAVAVGLGALLGFYFVREVVNDLAGGVQREAERECQKTRDAGAAAARAGLPHTANPYLGHYAPAAELWLEGWSREKEREAQK